MKNATKPKWLFNLDVLFMSVSKYHHQKHCFFSVSVCVLFNSVILRQYCKWHEKHLSSWYSLSLCFIPPQHQNLNVKSSFSSLSLNHSILFVCDDSVVYALYDPVLVHVWMIFRLWLKLVNAEETWECLRHKSPHALAGLCSWCVRVLSKCRMKTASMCVGVCVWVTMCIWCVYYISDKHCIY